ncbi:FHA domain-containing protein [Streptomyces sp. NPDC050400]|uniref:FHA domain-containing protein n=1 Tax=Streptomyces sp. NPDC050400 TaxID=3365610 RepID=UPI00378D69CA
MAVRVFLVAAESPAIPSVATAPAHCEIRTRSAATVQDLGSTNGIVVDGQAGPTATLRGQGAARPPGSWRSTTTGT